MERAVETTEQHELRVEVDCFFDWQDALTIEVLQRILIATREMYGRSELNMEQNYLSVEALQKQIPFIIKGGVE